MLAAVEPPEAHVIRAFLADASDESFGALFRAISPRVFRYLVVHGCERGVAEDLTQEVMLAVYRQSHQLRNGDAFWPWLLRIARNAWLQHLRRESRRVPVLNLASADVLPENRQDLMLATQFAEWLRWLEPSERRIMQLRFVEGLEYHEIASVLHLPVGTVQWRIFQFKGKLAARFGARAGV